MEPTAAAETIVYSTFETLQGLLTMTAIPVALFALWAEYFRKYLEAEKQDGLESNPDEEIRQVRTVGLFTLIAQISAQLVVISAFKPPLWASYVLFVIATVTQTRIQTNLERVIKPQTAAKSTLWMGVKAVFWMLSNILFCWVSSLALIAVVLVATPESMHKASWFPHLVIGVAFLGFCAGLAASAWLAPIAIKNVIPNESLTDSAKEAFIRKSFEKANLEAPTIRILNTDEAGPHNALMSGVPGASGRFKPTLFISSSLFYKLEPSELEAVLLHEASHLKLKHITRNIKFLLFNYVIAGVSCGVISTGLAKAVGRETFGAFDLAFSFVPFVVAMVLSRKRNRKHEFEADKHSVLSLGAEPDALISALRKLEAMNDVVNFEQTFRSEMGENKNFERQSNRLLATHPLVKDRIRAIEALRGSKQAPDNQDQSQDLKKAA